MTTQNTSTNWNLLRHVAQQQRDAATRQLGLLYSQRQDAQNKLELLLDYRLDYQRRLHAATRMGIHGDGLRNFQSFLTNLERAIEQQTDTLTLIQEQIYATQAAMAAAQRKIDSFQVLDQRQVNAANDRDRRRQQALQDEMASRSHLKLATGGD